MFVIDLSLVFPQTTLAVDCRTKPLRGGGFHRQFWLGVVSWTSGRVGVYEKKYPEFLSITEFVRFVELKDLSARTKQSYLANVVAISRHCQLDPSILSEREVADFLLVLRTVRNYAPSSMALIIVGLRTFFRDHLGRDWVLPLQIHLPHGHWLRTPA